MRKNPGGGRSGPLRGMLVLDFGQAAVGPVATEYLGMLGATVIKVENPRGDMVRNGGARKNGTGTTFLGNNLGKFGVVLDLKAPDGLERAKRLISLADVLIENFRSSEVMVRLGLGYDVLKELNPRIIYVSSSAYGRGGPLESMHSHEWLAQAQSGFTSVTGAAGGPGEFARGSANLDWNGAMVNTVAVLAALIKRERTGEGDFYLTSQYGASIYAGITRFAGVLAGGDAPPPLGAESPAVAPDGTYRTADGFIVLSAPTQQCWSRLCDALGLGALRDDPSFATNADRLKSRDALNARIGEVVASRDSGHWCARLAAADVPVAAVPREETLLGWFRSNEQIVATNLLCEVDSPYGKLASQSPHWLFERTPAAIASGPPLLGEHNETVFANLDDKASLIAALESAGGKDADAMREAS